MGARRVFPALLVMGRPWCRLDGMLLPLLANTASTPDIGSIIGQVAGGGVAGAVLTANVGAIKNKTA